MNNETKFDELPPEIHAYIIRFLGLLECYHFLFVNKHLYTLTKPYLNLQLKHKIEIFFNEITTTKDEALEKEVIERKFRNTPQIRTFESQAFSLLINSIERQIFFHKLKKNNQNYRPRINNEIEPLNEIVEEIDHSIADCLSEVLFYQQEVTKKNASCESVIKLRLQSPLFFYLSDNHFVNYEDEYDESDEDIEPVGEFREFCDDNNKFENGDEKNNINDNNLNDDNKKKINSENNNYNGNDNNNNNNNNDNNNDKNNNNNNNNDNNNDKKRKNKGVFGEDFTLNKRQKLNDNSNNHQNSEGNSGDEKEEGGEQYNDAEDEKDDTEDEIELTFFFTYGYSEHTRYGIYEQPLSFAISSNSKPLIKYLSNPNVNICSFDSRVSISNPSNEQEIKLALNMEKMKFRNYLPNNENYYTPDFDVNSTVISLYSIDDRDETEVIFNPLIVRKFLILLLNNRLKQMKSNNNNNNNNNNDNNNNNNNSDINKISELMKLISNNIISTMQLFEILFRLNCTKYEGDFLITPIETIIKKTLPTITFDFDYDDCEHVNPFNYFFQSEPIFLKKLLDKHFNNLFISNQFLSIYFWQYIKKNIWNYQLTQLEIYLQKNFNWLSFSRRFEPIDIINYRYQFIRYYREYQARKIVSKNPLFNERVLANIFNLKARSIAFELSESLTDTCHGRFSLYIPPIHKDQMNYITFHFKHEVEHIYGGETDCRIKVTAQSNIRLPLSKKIFDILSKKYFLIGSKSKACSFESNASTPYACGMVYHSDNELHNKYFSVLFDYLIEEFGLLSFKMERNEKGYFALQFIEFVIVFLASSQQAKRG